jgi:quercetin dioxygenase-like cupin family protein
MEATVRHRDEGDASWSLNSLITTKLDYAESGGAYCLMEHLLTPAANPPRHVHTDEEEAFYVLDGEIEFEVDGEVSVCTAGSFAFSPRGSAHSFAVLTDTARVLVLSSAPQGAPGGGFPEFVRSVGEPAPARILPVPQAPDPAAMAAAAAPHGIELLGPPRS